MIVYVTNNKEPWKILPFKNWLVVYIFKKYKDLYISSQEISKFSYFLLLKYILKYILVYEGWNEYLKFKNI